MLTILFTFTFLNTLLLLAILFIILFRKNRETFSSPSSASSPVLKNPGCDAEEQAACTKVERAYEEDSKNNPSCELARPVVREKTIQCHPCHDYEGEGCVPKTCAMTACTSP